MGGLSLAGCGIVVPCERVLFDHSDQILIEMFLSQWLGSIILQLEGK